jgi:hypothetical protein
MDGGKGFEDALTGEQKIRNFNINFGPQHTDTQCCTLPGAGWQHLEGP